MQISVSSAVIFAWHTSLSSSIWKLLLKLSNTALRWRKMALSHMYRMPRASLTRKMF